MSVQIHLLMCTKNEAARYLEACLMWHGGHFDSLFVYDDCSTDDTKEVALDCGAVVTTRPPAVPSFLEHEGAFRQDALRCFEQGIEPHEGDWVVVVDADEFVVPNGGTLWDVLHETAFDAEQRGAKSVRFRRPEVWNCSTAENGNVLIHPYIRVDGLWNTISCTRMFRWEPGGQIQQKAMGCGNEPTYIRDFPTIDPESFVMLHLGYADEADRREKYDRYTSLADHGHNSAHVESIITRPTLEPWTGAWFPVWRGVW